MADPCVAARTRDICPRRAVDPAAPTIRGVHLGVGAELPTGLERTRADTAFRRADSPRRAGLVATPAMLAVDPRVDAATVAEQLAFRTVGHAASVLADLPFATRALAASAMRGVAVELHAALPAPSSSLGAFASAGSVDADLTCRTGRSTGPAVPRVLQGIDTALVAAFLVIPTGLDTDACVAATAFVTPLLAAAAMIRIALAGHAERTAADLAYRAVLGISVRAGAAAGGA